MIQNGGSLRTPEIWQETHIRRTVIITNSLIPVQYEIKLINLDLGEGEPLQPNQSLDIPFLVMWCHVIITLSLPQASQPSFRIRLVAPWEAKSGAKICRDILNDSCCFVGEILMMRMTLCNCVVQRKRCQAWMMFCVFWFCVLIIWMNYSNGHEWSPCCFWILLAVKPFHELWLNFFIRPIVQKLRW